MTTLILFLLVLKHPLADIYMQTTRSRVQKEQYLGNGHRHYRDHGVLTFLIMLCFTHPLFALCIAVLDYLIHWHIDWGKTSLALRLGYGRDSDQYWRLHTLDQSLHFTTYGVLTVLYQLYAF